MQLRDEELNVVRSLITTIESGLPAPAHGANGAVKVAWDELVRRLALGPAPRVRSCPRCSGEVMFDATLCMYCWSKLVPPAHLAPQNTGRE